MYKSLISLCIGIYIGTYYNCKPIIQMLLEKTKEHFPDKKN
jgi:hypothetical protein